ncbi:MAG: deoxyribose-phosphate aldolase, partial [Thermoleophilia bacterium]|nr:deoxyribose-phosphate aldolase [Thermoleophilia bacterium]
HEEVRAGCAQAAAAHLASVSVWPAHVALAVAELAGSDTRVRAAVGFPFGQDTPSIKLAACDRALADGADELAVMLDHGALVDPRDNLAAARVELEQLLEHAGWSPLTAARGRSELTIVIEATMLDLTALDPLLQRLHESPAGFLQTGSGHQPRAVTQEHVRVLRELLPADVAIVAVGGVASLQDAEDLVVSGASRVGSGSAIAIIEQERQDRAARQSRNTPS